MPKVSYKKIGIILAAASGFLFLFNIIGAAAWSTPVNKLSVLDKNGCNIETEEVFMDPTDNNVYCVPKGTSPGSATKTKTRPCLPCGNAQYTMDEEGKEVRCINGCAEGTGDSDASGTQTDIGTQTSVDKLPVTDGAQETGSSCNSATEYEHVDITGEVKCIPKGTTETKTDVSVNSFLRLSTLKKLFRGGPSSVQLSPTGPKTIKDIVIKVLDFLITLAIPFAILAIIWAGFMFVTAQGNEQKIGKARQNLLWTVVGVAIILASKALIGYIQDLIVGGGSSAASFFDRIRGTLNLVIELLFVLATVYFFWGVINYIGAAGDESKLRDGKRHMIWGIVGMVIMAGAWSLVTILADYIK